MRLVLLFLLLLLAPDLAQAQQRKAKSRKARKTQTAPLVQGVDGVVLFLSGNFMPGPDATGGSTKPVVRKIHLFSPALELEEMESGAMDGPFIRLGKRKPAYTITSGTDGHFRIATRPGTYSLMVEEEDGRFYCNGSDGTGTLCPVTVAPKEWTETTVQINYAAVY